MEVSDKLIQLVLIRSEVLHLRLAERNPVSLGVRLFHFPSQRNLKLLKTIRKVQNVLGKVGQPHAVVL